MFCVQPKKTLRSIPLLGKLEVNGAEALAGRTRLGGGTVRTCDGFCREMTAVAMEMQMAAAGAGLAWAPGRE